MARVLQRIYVVHRRPFRWRQLGRLRVVQAAPDVAPRDPLHVIGVNEAQASFSGDHDPVEYIDFGYFQYMLKGADLRARTAQHRGPADCRLIGNSDLVSHTGTRLATRKPGHLGPAGPEEPITGTAGTWSCELQAGHAAGGGSWALTACITRRTMF